MRVITALMILSIILIGSYIAFEKRFTGEIVTVTEVNAQEGYFRCYDDLGNFKHINANSGKIDSLQINAKYFIKYTSDIFGKNNLEEIELVSSTPAIP
jgi:hypothetical protein